jgi:phosphoglycerate dehydrogenase-like enzyme
VTRCDAGRIIVFGSTAGRLTDAQVAQIRASAGNGMEILETPAEIDDRIGDAIVLAVPPGQITSARLRRASRLRWIHLWAAGVDGAMVPELGDGRVVVTSSKGNGAVPLAEHAMMLMLMLNRNAVRSIEAQRKHRWDQFMHSELNGLTCGVVGLGHSGLEVARKAAVFNMQVIGLRRTYRPTPEVQELYPRDRLREFLARSDVVVVTVPRTSETIGMFGEQEFRAMKPSALYVCFSRGGIADDRALLQALREGWIAGAGLDVHAQEPLPADSPFWDLPNTIVTPHNGASTPQTRQRAVDIFLDNLRRFSRDEEMLNVVDLTTGY